MKGMRVYCAVLFMIVVALSSGTPRCRGILPLAPVGKFSPAPPPSPTFRRLCLSNSSLSSNLSSQLYSRILDSCNALMKAIRVLILKSKDLQGEIVEEGMVRNLMLESYLYLIVSLVA
jgi:hypothetical protein